MGQQKHAFGIYQSLGEASTKTDDLLDDIPGEVLQSSPAPHAAESLSLALELIERANDILDTVRSDHSED